MKKNKVTSIFCEYDDQSKWAREGIFKPPSHVDVKAYQKALDKIVGVALNGESIIRLQWAWECRRWENIEWDGFGNATKGEWRQKYRALTVEIGNDEYVDIAPPRWVLEERFEPEQYAPTWEKTRYKPVTKGNPPFMCPKCYGVGWINPWLSMGPMLSCQHCGEITDLPTVRQDMFGPAPREGWYNLLPEYGVIAEHENRKRCCDRLWKKEKAICWGRYKLPDEKELTMLKRARQARDKDVELNPREALSEEALRQAQAWGLQMMSDAKVASRQEAKEMWKDEVAVHGARIVPDGALAALAATGRRVPTLKTRFT